MTTNELFEKLTRLGIELSLRGDRVRARGPKEALTPRLREEIASHKADLLEILSSDPATGDGAPSPRATRERVPKLSPGQIHIWNLVRRDPRTAAYNLGEAFRLVGPLDVAALEVALGELAARHDLLHSEIIAGSEPALRILPPEVVTWTHHDASAGANSLETTRRLVNDIARRPFDLERGPLARFHLVRLGETDHVVSIVTHHIISDGWSFEVIYKELSELYAAAGSSRPSQLDAPPPCWTDVAEAQRTWSDSSEAEATRVYWREKLAAPLRPLRLPRESRASRSYAGGHVPVRLPAEVRAAIDRLSGTSNTSAFMVLVAAYAFLLREMSGQDDILLCAPAACRERPELQGLVGYLNNVLALRIDLSGDPTFLELLERTREVALGAFRHQLLPFQEIAEWPHLARVPLTRAMFAFQGEAPHSLQLEGLTSERIAVDTGTANFDLALYVARGAEGFDGELSFKLDTFSPKSAEAFVDRLAAVISSAARDPTRRVSEINGTARLPGASAGHPEGHAGDAPVFNALEVQLGLIWERVLRTWPIYLDDDFFALGGHSLLAVRLLDEIEAELGRGLPLATFFEVTTIRSLARALQDDGWVPPSGALVAMHTGRSKIPLFLVHSFEGHVFFYNELAHSMGPEHSVYGLQASGLDGTGRLASRVERIADVHLREIRGTQPRGPYYIGAMCFGVAVALELVSRLHAEGEQAHVIFLDSVLDGRQALLANQPVGAPSVRVTRWLRDRVHTIRERLRERLREYRASFGPGPYGLRERRMRLALIEAWEAYRPRRLRRHDPADP